MVPERRREITALGLCSILSGTMQSRTANTLADRAVRAVGAASSVRQPQTSIH